MIYFKLILFQNVYKFLNFIVSINITSKIIIKKLYH